MLPPPAVADGSPEFREFYDSTRRYMLVRHVVQFLSVLVGRAATGPVPLMYRGCISVGQMAVRGESFIGDAVDEAGARFEACDGAFVFLTPDAADVFTKRHPYLQMGHPAYFVPYRVPMKSGEFLETITINPLLYLDGAARPSAVAAFVREFGPPESQPAHVRSKAEHTWKYLEYLAAWQCWCPCHLGDLPRSARPVRVERCSACTSRPSSGFSASRH